MLVKSYHAAPMALKPQITIAGKLSHRHLRVRTGCTKFTETNCTPDNRQTIAVIMTQCGSNAKNTMTTMFQQAGKPENDLSSVYIRVSTI